MRWPREALTGERLGIWTIGLLAIAVAALVGFAGTPFAAPEGSVERAAAAPGVEVTAAHGGYAMQPTDADPETGVVFYPGARVDPSAYVPLLAPVVDRAEVAIVVPRPRLNLAVFEPTLADPVLANNPGIERWYVGGHSLGGAMACRYAASNPDAVAGVVLFGAYCDRSIADTDLRVLAVGGTRDTVLGTDRGALRPDTLPPTATIHRIEGANHTSFGSYAGQRGDSPATISRDAAHAAIREPLVDFLRNQSSSPISSASRSCSRDLTSGSISATGSPS